MTRRATARGAERPAFPPGARADVLVCGASFAGLAAARELAGAGADVLVLDRYEIGERATSACAVPTPWLRALGLEASARQEIPCMRFGTPHGGARVRLPWSWSAFDYAELCRALWAQCGEARFATAKVHGRTGATVHTDRGDVSAPLILDALGWRRVLAARGYQPPEAPISRGLEVHPDVGPGHPDALDVWIDRSLVPRGYGWSVPAGGHARIGVGSYAPRDHVKEPTQDLVTRYGAPAVRYQGNWFPHRLRRAAEDGVFFAGDAAGHCLPLSGEGIRTALYFGGACGRELRAVVEGRRSRAAALRRYRAFSARHAPAYALMLAGQRVIPRVPPRLLTAVIRLAARPRLTRAAFTRYLAIAPAPTAPSPSPRPSASASASISPRPISAAYR